MDLIVQQLLDLQNHLQQQAATIAALQAPQVPQPVVPNPIGQFALTPATTTPDVIDLASATGIKLYKSITTPFEIKFDGKVQNLVPFIDNPRQKVSHSSWNQALLVISDQHPLNPQQRNLLQSR